MGLTRYNVMTVGTCGRGTHPRIDWKKKRKGVNPRCNLWSQAFNDLLPAVLPRLLKCLSLPLTTASTEDQVLNAEDYRGQFLFKSQDRSKVVCPINCDVSSNGSENSFNGDYSLFKEILFNFYLRGQCKSLWERNWFWPWKAQNCRRLFLDIPSP